jgi:hypothetical protein
VTAVFLTVIHLLLTSAWTNGEAHGPSAQPSSTLADPSLTQTPAQTRLLIPPVALSPGIATDLLAKFQAVVAQGAAIESVLQIQSHASCAELSCYFDEATAGDIPLVLLSRVEVEERSYRVSIELYEAMSRRILATSSERCDLCGLAEVEDLVATRTLAIRDKIADYSMRSATLSITSDPSGAAISIDSESVGSTPIQTMVVPGVHTLRARFPSGVELVREVKSVRGVREIQHFADVSSSAIDSHARERLRSPAITLQGWGWLATTGGALSVATGAILLGMNGRPYRSDCSGNNVDINGTCRFRYNTGTAAGLTLGIGGALLTTGVVLLLTHRHRLRSRHR